MPACPVATATQLQKDHQMVERAVNEGTRLLCGGAPLQLKKFPGGFYFAPTIPAVEGSDNFIS